MASKVFPPNELDPYPITGLIKPSMKHKIILLSLLMMTVGAVFGRNIAIDLTKAPPMQLGDAYVIAVEALGPSAKSLHCTSARVEIAFALHGEWMFDFYSTTGDFKQVMVPFEKAEKPRVFDGGVPAYL